MSSRSRLHPFPRAARQPTRPSPSFEPRHVPMPFVAGLLLFAVAQARDTVPSYVHDAAREARAGRASADVKTAGRLDEPAWAAATPVTTFTQLNPQPGQPATERTE